MTSKPYSRPSLTKEDINAVVDVLESQFLTTGPMVPQLEVLFSKTFKAPYASACSNGTAALHLASMAMGLGPGDYVIVPSITFLATANAVRMCGAEVVFCDVDPNTGMMTLDTLKQAASSCDGEIKAVYVVHMGGYCADMVQISEYAKLQDWMILEDACHALGGSVQGHLVGSCDYSDISTFSLHATKTFTSGEGGIVATRHAHIKERVDRLRNHGMTRNSEDFDLSEGFDQNGEPNPWHYEMHELGFNYRLTDIQAALGVSQIKSIDDVIKKRQTLAEFYQTELAELNDVMRPVQQVNEGTPVLHLFQVLIEFSKLNMDRGIFMNALSKEGIGTQVHYFPVHRQPYYEKRYGQRELIGVNAFFERVLALPFYTNLSLDDAASVVSALKKQLK